MKEKLKFFIGRIKAGRLQEMWRQTIWIYQYARRYWLIMIFYTILGMVGTGIALLTSWISKDLVDIITGYETGALIQTFCMMIGLNVGTTLLNQASDSEHESRFRNQGGYFFQNIGDRLGIPDKLSHR